MPLAQCVSCRHFEWLSAGSAQRGKVPQHLEKAKQTIPDYIVLSVFLKQQKREAQHQHNIGEQHNNGLCTQRSCFGHLGSRSGACGPSSHLLCSVAARLHQLLPLQVIESVDHPHAKCDSCFVRLPGKKVIHGKLHCFAVLVLQAGVSKSLEFQRLCRDLQAYEGKNESFKPKGDVCIVLCSK